jgi:uncharacterized membrane protein
MLNPFEMVVLIVAIVMFASVMRARYAGKRREEAAADDPEIARSREEIRALKERIAVLERIATDKESTLERQIERLRD